MTGWGRYLALALVAPALLLSMRPGDGMAQDRLPAWLGDRFVCARLVFALDGSGSTGAGAFGRQIRSLGAALRAPATAIALQDCLPGRVAVAVIVWAGPADQRLCQRWMAIDGSGGLQALAERLDRCPYPGGTTDIGAALERAIDLITTAPFDSHYRIVFLATNGLTDIGAGPRLKAARARAVAEGITVNGHALLQPASRWQNRTPARDPFEHYVAQEVTAGPRAFTTASDHDEDEPAVLSALVRMLRQELH